MCFRADGRETNRWLVESGNAVDWEKYSKGAYANAQWIARARGVGISGADGSSCLARRGRSVRIESLKAERI